MAMTPKQMKAYLEKLARERRADERRTAASPFAGLGLGRAPGTPGPKVDVVLGDDNWMRDRGDDEKKKKE